jgi:drug/metabolite transporter (DMT)-like permease
VNQPVSVSTIGLFIPFLIVFIAVLFTGHHPAQIAGAAILLIVPAVILLLRHRATRKPA